MQSAKNIRAVFVLQHVREYELTDGEDVKMIGVYSTRQRAEDAVSRLLLQPGFRDHPDGFSIDEYDLDKDHWTEGFGVKPDEEQ